MVNVVECMFVHAYVIVSVMMVLSVLSVLSMGYAYEVLHFVHSCVYSCGKFLYVSDRDDFEVDGNDCVVELGVTYNKYIHTYIHTYIHNIHNIHTYIHTYIHNTYTNKHK